MRLFVDYTAIGDSGQRHPKLALHNTFDLLDPPSFDILRLNQKQRIGITPCRIRECRMSVVEELNEAIILIARRVMPAQLAL